MFGHEFGCYVPDFLFRCTIINRLSVMLSSQHNTLVVLMKSRYTADARMAFKPTSKCGADKRVVRNR